MKNPIMPEKAENAVPKFTSVSLCAKVKHTPNIAIIEYMYAV